MRISQWDWFIVGVKCIFDGVSVQVEGEDYYEKLYRMIIV